MLSLSTDLVDLRHELKEKLAADGVYKLQYVGRGSCLNFADNNKPPVMASCDHPQFLEARTRNAVAGVGKRRPQDAVAGSA